MPLSIFIRNSDNSVATDDYDNQLYEQLELKGELERGDCFLSEEFRKNANIGLFDAWMYDNFEQNIQWTPESPDFDACKQELAQFINDEIKGPYYVDQGYINTRWILSIILMDEADRQAFAERYPEWDYNEKASARNAELLRKWKESGVSLENKSLYDYALS